MSNDKLTEALRDLRSVLCDPHGKCCINGTDRDRVVVTVALAKLDEIQARAADAAQAQAQSGEWVMVPRKLTRAMAEVACEIGVTTEDWYEMLAAAPQPQAAEPVAVIESAEDRHGPYLTHADVVLRVWNGYAPKAGDEIYTHPQPAQDAKLPSDEDFRLHLGELTPAELRVARAAFRYATVKESGR